MRGATTLAEAATMTGSRTMMASSDANCTEAIELHALNDSAGRYEVRQPPVHLLYCPHSSYPGSRQPLFLK